MPIQAIPFADLHTFVGRYLGASAWTTIEQFQTDRFAELTGDDEWIHVDVERAARQFGHTIVHGYHLLALIPFLGQQIFEVEGLSHGLNYGLDRLRFVETVNPGQELRLHETLTSVRPRGDAMMLTVEARLEAKGNVRPALVADCLFLLFPSAAMPVA